MEISPKTKKSTFFFYLYRGAFEQLVCPRRGTFASLFSKNANARDRPGGGGWALLELTDALGHCHVGLILTGFPHYR